MRSNLALFLLLFTTYLPANADEYRDGVRSCVRGNQSQCENMLTNWQNFPGMKLILEQKRWTLSHNWQMTCSSYHSGGMAAWSIELCNLDPQCEWNKKNNFCHDARFAVLATSQPSTSSTTTASAATTKEEVRPFLIGNNIVGAIVGLIIFAGGAIVLYFVYYLIIQPLQNRAALVAGDRAFAEKTKPRDPNTPSTAEETKKAFDHLRVTVAYIKDITKEPTNTAQLASITMASRSLAQARALDPNVTISDPDMGEQTQDWLSAHLLFLESKLLLYKAEAAEETRIEAIRGGDRMREKHFRKKKKHDLNQALTAILASLKYAPRDAIGYRHLGLVYYGMGKTKEGADAITKSHQIDPNDIETLKLYTQL